MLVPTVLAALLLLAPASLRGGPTDLRITVWPKGRPGASVHWTLRCGPPRGTLPHPARACRRLAALAGPFAPVPRDAVCTQIYGGPQIAVVAGRYRGLRVWALFRRSDGCQIARWNRIAFLLPVRT